MMQHVFFSFGPYMPHGCCYLWNPGLVGLQVISNLLISLSCLSRPFTLASFVFKRRDLPFLWIFVCGGIFILACGILMIRSDPGEAQLEVALQDSGPGIDPQQVPHIFGTFFYIKANGMGMGLSISRSIVEAHRSRLWASFDPVVNGVSLFYAGHKVGMP
jgi:hypothetical protein